MRTTLTPRAAPLRPAWAVAVLALALAACGGGGADAPPADGRAGALSASRPGELTGWVQQRLRSLTAAGTLPGAGTGGASVLPGAGPVPALAMGDAAARSQPLLQEEGVDESDLLLADGNRLVALQPRDAGGPELTTWSRGDDGRAQRQGGTALAAEGYTDPFSMGMVFNGARDAVAVVTQQWRAGPMPDNCDGLCAAIMPPQWMRSEVSVQRVGLADPAAPQSGERLVIDGQLVDTRRVGNTLVVVTSHVPFLAVQALPSTTPAAEREAAIAAVTASQLLPRLRRNGGPEQPLLADTDCWVQRDNASPIIAFTTVTLIDLASAALPQVSRCFVGGTEALYMTQDRLVLATTRWAEVAASDLRMPGDIATDLHLFSFDGSRVQWQASGSVPGHLGWDPRRKSLRLSLHDGHLRVLSFTGTEGWGILGDAATRSASPATLTVLRPEGGTLRTVGQLPNARRPAAIGKPGEQLHGVRFVGARGYAVTFRRIDPLYVMDLSDPTDPRVTGELEVPGFSEHLIPLSPTQLLGVGRDADANGVMQGLQFSLLDVSDPTTPRQRASLVLGTAGSQSALDWSRLALALRIQGSTARAALPVSLTGANWANWERGLQRLDIDTAAGTLQALPLLSLPSSGFGWAPLWQERALLVGDQVYHLHDGVIDTHAW